MAVYQALGAFFVALLNERWAEKGTGQIFSFLFQEVNGLVKNEQPDVDKPNSGWERTWGNWGNIKNTSNPFLGNAPYLYPRVLGWCQKRRLISPNECDDFTSMFYTMVNWESCVAENPEGLHKTAIFIVDKAASIASLRLVDIPELNNASAYSDDKTGDLFDFATLSPIHLTGKKRTVKSEKVRAAALHLIKVGETLVQQIPEEHVAIEENLTGARISAYGKTVQMSLLFQEGENILNTVFERGGSLAAKEFLKHLQLSLDLIK